MTAKVAPSGFMPGLKLSERFFREAVRPILRAGWPKLRYSAGLLGWGSDAMGCDTPRSMDHMWGPRLLLFLSEADRRRHASDISGRLRHALPHVFLGFPVSFGRPDAVGVRISKRTTEGPVDHMAEVFSPESFLERYLGVRSTKDLRQVNWLGFSEQSLLEVADGRVFHDGLRRMCPLRRRLAYYPRDVWLHKLAGAWQALTDAEAFPGRCAELGDTIGWRVLAARQVERVMRLCFLQERVYMPYGKWLGTAFGRLRCGRRVRTLIKAALAAPTWPEAESHLVRAYEYVARAQNRLGVAARQPAKASPYFGRPYRVIWGDRFAVACRDAIHSAEIRRRTHVRPH